MANQLTNQQQQHPTNCSKGDRAPWVRNRCCCCWWLVGGWLVVGRWLLGGRWPLAGWLLAGAWRRTRLEEEQTGGRRREEEEGGGRRRKRSSSGRAAGWVVAVGCLYQILRLLDDGYFGATFLEACRLVHVCLQKLVINYMPNKSRLAAQISFLQAICPEIVAFRTILFILIATPPPADRSCHSSTHPSINSFTKHLLTHPFICSPSERTSQPPSHPATQPATQPPSQPARH